jgi:hypothetical protein
LATWVVDATVNGAVPVATVETSVEPVTAPVDVTEVLFVNAVAAESLDASDVLSTLPKPTSVAANVTAPERPATDCTGAAAAALDVV